MPQSVCRVQPKLEFIQPAYSPLLVRLAHALLPVLMRFRLRAWLPAGIARVEAHNVETLAELYQKFYQGQVRFLMAFRHVEIEDPLSALYLLSRAVPKAARQQGISLPRPLHAHFLYERGMPLWAGRWLGWVLAHLGGVPVRRGRRPDWPAMRQARQLMRQGQLPMALAPEGATNGHSEKIGPFEPGTAQLGFWCVEDLLKAQRSETVYILPVNLQYQYCRANWAKLDRLLGQLERDSGLVAVDAIAAAAPAACYQRIVRLGEHLLETMTQFYSRFCHQTLDSEADKPLAERLQGLLNGALLTAEHAFGLPAKGNLVDRCRRIEEAGWTHIYRDDLPNRRQLPPLAQGLADWVAQLASLTMLHMRLVESLVAVTGSYLSENPSFERCAETTLLIFDVLARIRGDKLPRRPRLGYRQVIITVGEPISVTERWDDYQVNHRAARKAVLALTETLQTALTSLIR
ncbi:MAG: 1-acyl-sn-glycerol-3-phosphate acyltransferase [Leptolyngbya sp. SIO4C1]|nr:1-acyl-sn-glycerol-3-phosphate acyltransferase [Leptolyngbya sp. SIO4C1]